MKLKQLTALTFTAGIILTSCGSSTSTDNNQTTTETTTPKTASEKAKLTIFNDISKTRQALSGNGIGDLGDWKSDQMGGFMSITNYYQFGDGMPQNNIAYYLESQDESYIQTAKLTLNINNKSEKKEAIAKFKDVATATFKSLSLEIPQGLIEAIDKGKEFESSNDNFSTSLKLYKSKIETWTVKIETK